MSSVILLVGNVGGADPPISCDCGVRICCMRVSLFILRVYGGENFLQKCVHPRWKTLSFFPPQELRNVSMPIVSAALRNAKFTTPIPMLGP
jgi:hypothetical protein